MALRQRPSLKVGETPNEIADALESLRRGTLQQFESDWILLNPGQSASRRHGLGEEVPALVSSDLDDVGDGRNARSTDPSDVTIQSTVESITITNDTTERQYFRIRAR